MQHDRLASRRWRLGFGRQESQYRVGSFIMLGALSRQMNEIGQMIEKMIARRVKTKVAADDGARRAAAAQSRDVVAIAYSLYRKGVGSECFRFLAAGKTM